MKKPTRAPGKQHRCQRGLAATVKDPLPQAAVSRLRQIAVLKKGQRQQ